MAPVSSRIRASATDGTRMRKAPFERNLGGGFSSGAWKSVRDGRYFFFAAFFVFSGAHLPIQ
jgi:hypothetical protein